MKSIITTTFAALLLLTACSKKETATAPTPNTPKTHKELIVGSWVLTAATSDDPDDPYKPGECEYDDFYTFNSDGTWVFQDGGTICEPDLPMISGTWQMNNYPVLDMDSKQYTHKPENKILQLDETTFKFERWFPTWTDEKYTFTLKRK